MIEIGSGKKLSIDDVVAVANGARVTVSPRTLSMLRTRRAQVERAIAARAEPAYGFNRGFGHNVDVPVHENVANLLQENLIRSHAAGTGDFTPAPVVRAAMVLRAHALSLGFSGVRPEVVMCLVNLLNRNLVPAVPLHGSVGASGDLAPLAHIALAMMGEGELLGANGSGTRPARPALRRAGIRPLDIRMKEGLALLNGVQFSTAFGILAAHKLRILLDTAVIATALSAQVLLGSDSPYSEEFQLLRPHRGALAVAGSLRALMKDSPMRESHRHYAFDGEIQDPYSLRCAPQILGTCFDLITEAEDCFVVEANSVTDNPLILRSKSGGYDEIVSGGHFHGMPVAVKLFNLTQAASIISALTNVRAARFIDESRNKGLGNDLIWPELSDSVRSASSGMMIPEYVTAALTNTIWGAAMPSHLFSLPTSAGQEDHVSMSAGLAVRLWEVLPRLSEVLAIELAMASQAAAIREISDTVPSKHLLPRGVLRKLERMEQEFSAAVGKTIDQDLFVPRLKIHLSARWPKSARRLSPLTSRVQRIVHAKFPILKRDRAVSGDIKRLADAVWDGTVRDACAEAFR